MTALLAIVSGHASGTKLHGGVAGSRTRRMMSAIRVTVVASFEESALWVTTKARSETPRGGLSSFKGNASPG